MSERQLIVAPSYPVSDLERMAKAFAASKLFGIQNAEQGLALCLLAQAEGLHPATAARDYHIINGRPAKKAEAMLRDFIAAGGKVEWHTLTDEQADATFSHPAGGSARIDWTLKRAQQAGINTPMWKKYPRQMLRARLVSEGVRTVCPSATSGMYVPEEVQDIVASERPAPAPEPEAVQDAEFAPIVKRKSSAQATRDGDHTAYLARIEACETLEALDALEQAFDADTAEMPLSWLDPMRDKIILRREELSAPVPDEVLEAASEMDAAFSGTLGGGSVRGVSRNARDMEDAA